MNLLLLLPLQLLKADYVLRVQVLQYSNPDNTCVQCNGGCCDGPRQMQSSSTCPFFDRCESQFFYCPMPLGRTLTENAALGTVNTNVLSDRAGELGCLETITPSALSSDISHNGLAIDFSGNQVLDLPNPFEFQVTADRWQVRSAHGWP